MEITELLERQLTQGRDILSRIDAMRELPKPRNDFGDGMAVFSVPQYHPKFDAQEAGKLSSEMQKWQNVTLDVLKKLLSESSTYVQQFTDSITDKCYAYNAQRGLKKEITRGIEVLESVQESINLNLVELEVKQSMPDKKHLVFISHASKDAAIIEPFMRIILKEALGLRDENIICTTFERTGVNPGDSIPAYIQDNIACCRVFLSMVSQNYQASVVCMNEVGAAWALGKKPIPVLLPGANFSEIGWLFNLNKAIRIDDGQSLDHLAEVICNGIGKQMETPLHWNQPRADFLAAISSVPAQVKEDDQPCRLVFQDATQETTIHPKYRARYYFKPYPNVSAPMPDTVTALNSMTSVLGAIASAQSIQQRVAPKVITNPSRETNLSQCQLAFWFYNMGDALESIEVRLKAPDGVTFSERNYREIGYSVRAYIAHSDSYSIDEQSYWCRIGDFNADSNRAMPLLYIELQAICNTYDNFTKFEDYYPQEIEIPYTISTKHKKFYGSLCVKVEPEFESESIENEKMDGKVQILPFLEQH